MATFTDFRYNIPAATFFGALDSKETCTATLEQWIFPSKIETTFWLDPSLCDIKMPFNLEFIRNASIGVVPEPMRDSILYSLTNGFRSGYRGHGFYQRDFAGSLKQDELKLAITCMDKEIAKGHVIGPFDQCPFPNQWCSKQAVICQLFFRDKHKFIKDGQKRLIGNKSFPIGKSFLVPRMTLTIS